MYGEGDKLPEVVAHAPDAGTSSRTAVRGPGDAAERLPSHR